MLNQCCQGQHLLNSWFLCSVCSCGRSCLPPSRITDSDWRSRRSWWAGPPQNSPSSSWGANTGTVPAVFRIWIQWIRIRNHMLYTEKLNFYYKNDVLGTGTYRPFFIFYFLGGGAFSDPDPRTQIDPDRTRNTWNRYKYGAVVACDLKRKFRWLGNLRQQNKTRPKVFLDGCPMAGLAVNPFRSNPRIQYTTRMFGPFAF